MGVGMSSMLALAGTASVAAGKVATAISEANDANKNKQMAAKARANAKQAKLDKQTLKKEVEKTVHKAFSQNDPKARADLRMMGGM